MSRLGAVRFIAIIGIVLVISAEAAFTVIAAASGVALTAQMRERTEIAARYRSLESILYRERLAERSYLATQSTAFAQERAAAQSDFAARVAWLRGVLNADRIAELDRVVAEHDRYAALGASAMFAARRGDPERARRIDTTDVEPAYVRVSRSLPAALAAFDLRTRQRNADGLRRATFLRDASIGLGALGITLVAALLALVEFYKRRGDEAIRLRVQALELSLRSDSLTGLGNARGFGETLARALSTMHRAGARANLLLVDIDDFKAANDARGQAAGDDLLVRLGEALASEFPRAASFRLHADRFAVLCASEHGCDERMGQEIVQRCARRLNGLTVSAGYAHVQRGDDDEDLLERAEAALRAAKHEGGHLFMRYDDVRDRVFVYSTSRARAVRRLLDERAIDMHFQPIVETTTGRIIAYEALARPAERFGLRSAQELFDIAERLHRSLELDRICIRSALLAAAQHRPEALLFVNAAPASLEAERLDVERCFRDIRSVGLDPRNIVIELTERKISNSKLLASRIAQIQEWGMRVALDDTGAGYAGLDVLSTIPFDFVKIDRSLIVRAMTDERARSVLLGLLSIAHGAGSTVIAEGIETAEMHAFTRALEVDIPQGVIAACQGYAFAHPHPEFVDAIPVR